VLSENQQEMRKWLIASDLHLSDRPKDGHRFGIFKWMAKQQAKFDPEFTFILGDLTQDKDNHSSTLVNRIIDELTLLRPPVLILRGNHDGRDPNNPFFKFLNCIDGINFIVEPEICGSIGLIPHCRTQQEFEQACSRMPKGLEALMLHQTIAGAIAETNRPLNGFSASPIEELKPFRCYAGDVHKPQQCGPVTYIGAPYHTRFGDAFDPRVLLVSKDQEQDLFFPCPRKMRLTINAAEEIRLGPKLRTGDQVKVTIRLAREEMTDWPKHKQRVVERCKELGLELFGPDVEVAASAKSAAKEKQAKTKDDVFAEFCLSENVSSDIKQAGKGLLEGS